jgi:predicted metal-binding protein
MEVSMDFLEQIEKAKELLSFALNIEGMSGSKLIHIKSVVVDDRVRFQCSQSGCRDYGKKLKCPPNTPSVDEFRKVLSSYFMALVVQMRAGIHDIKNWESETDELALKLHDAVYKIEKKAFSLGFPFAAGLIGGSCKLCKECPGASVCIKPEKARPSMEGLGIDVIATCRNIGLEVVFSPDTIVWTGMILIN